MAQFSYPYPVLGNGQSIEGNFEVKLRLERTEYKTLEVFIEKLEITNADILNLVAEGKAESILRLQSSSCFYSESFVIKKGSTLSIEETNLINKCEAQALIVLTNDLEYFSPTFSEDYADTVFPLKKKDIIGMSGRLSWDVPRAYEKKTSNSIFKWAMLPEENEDQQVRYDLEGDEIVVFFPYFNAINPVALMFKSKTFTAYWSFVLPGLTEACRVILDEEERIHYEEFRWFHYLEQVMKIKKLDHSDPFVLAQQLFVSEAFSNMFNELSN